MEEEKRMKTPIHLLVVCLALGCTLLCAACGDGKKALDFSNKSDEQIAEHIKSMNKKITDVTVIPTAENAVIFVTWLADSGPSPILMEAQDIRNALESIANAKGNDTTGWVVIATNEIGVDKLGNKSPTLTIKQSWDMNTLKKVNWKNIESWQITDLSQIEEVGPFGNDAIRTYCKEGGSSYGKVFCSNIGL